MVKWEGWAKNRQCPLESLDKDADGEDLGLELLPYDDGRPSPVYIMPVQAPEGGGAEDEGLGENMEDGDGGEAAATVEITAKHPLNPLGITSMTWSRLEPEGVTCDERARTHPDRQKPVLNAGFGLLDITSLFYYLLPDAWLDIQLGIAQSQLPNYARAPAHETLRTGCFCHGEENWPRMPA
ncbi:hypothetical protein AB1Y20_018821 [Prymnesium parvum]|uniref:Uncharacterized protein n=1 Tax=Prymnesium parvum TaxID=97485 RepID=A0AB34JSB5_PRYPA